MKLSNYRLLILASSLLLTSCGYGLKETYKGVPYCSPIFEENYFNEWADNINPYNEKNKITETIKEREITADDFVFTQFGSNEFRLSEPKTDEYNYEYDIYDSPDERKPYGPAVKLSAIDKSFKYGVTSKLFDGQLFCNGKYQNARTQVEPMENGEGKGFGVQFAKECTRATYIMMNLKCSVVTKESQHLDSHINSVIKLHIGFYYKNSKGYTYQPLTYTLSKVPTNSSENHSATNGSYVCFGFNLANILPKDDEGPRLAGISFQYEKIEDDYSKNHPDEKTMHAVMLYEISLPYSSWH